MCSWSSSGNVPQTHGSGLSPALMLTTRCARRSSAGAWSSSLATRQAGTRKSTRGPRTTAHRP
jgi:hypothetical protein